jgi:bifunctional UDP-N-acetylglucosamine pyrophosphorylase/glucosamine-1-phosphate N-acetyltransferase
MTAAVVLAAGQGTRMRSKRAKVLHEVAGLPMIEHVLRAVQALELAETVVVVGAQKEAVAAAVGRRATLVEQPGVLGTGDAVRRALGALSPDTHRVLVLYGDCPLVPPDLLRDLLNASGRDAATLVTAVLADPTGYGRVVRDADGTIRAIVEEREADAATRAIHEVNTGIGVWERDWLERVLPELVPHHGEVYLTDAVGALIAAGARVGSLQAPDPERVMGINTRAELARAEARARRDVLERLMAAGVTVRDPATTYVDAGVEVGLDTVLEPMTFLRGRTVVGEGAVIGPMTTLVDSYVGDHSVVVQSVVEGARIGPHCHVGPMSHLRPGTYLDRDVHLGNFVEVKNSRLGLGMKAGHHCYLGDATIGHHVNIGAGTVIVNYDGVAKHPTYIGDEAFIGCNANLVAPVEIGASAYVAAGSTVTHNVPAEALAIARGRQENKPNWVRARRQRVSGPRD